MLKIIQAESMKIRHNKLFILSVVLSVGFPLLIALKDMKLNSLEGYYIDAASWIGMTQDIGLTVLLNVLSGIIITLSFQKEYSERTIIAQITCPITRCEFIIGKIAVWAGWHIALTVLLFLSSALGMAMLYQGEVTLVLLADSFLKFVLHGSLIFLTLLPLAAAAVMQKEVFYPSLLLCLAFTGIATMSNVMNGILPFALPWSAARVLGTMAVDGMYLSVSAVSVACCAVLGLIISLLLFRKQHI